MFDQSFSAENFMTIFHEENRKGNIAFDSMPDAYRVIVGEIKGLQDRANIIIRKKFLKTKQKSGFSSSPKVPCKEKALTKFS